MVAAQNAMEQVFTNYVTTLFKLVSYITVFRVQTSDTTYKSVTVEIIIVACPKKNPQSSLGTCDCNSVTVLLYLSSWVFR